MLTSREYNGTANGAEGKSGRQNSSDGDGGICGGDGDNGSSTGVGAYVGGGGVEQKVGMTGDGSDSLKKDGVAADHADSTDQSEAMNVSDGATSGFSSGGASECSSGTPCDCPSGGCVDEDIREVRAEVRPYLTECELEQSLVEAAGTGDLQQVVEMLREGATVDAVNLKKSLYYKSEVNELEDLVSDDYFDLTFIMHTCNICHLSRFQRLFVSLGNRCIPII